VDLHLQMSSDGCCGIYFYYTGISVIHSRRIYFKVITTEKNIYLDCFSVSINTNNFFYMKRERREAVVKTKDSNDGPNSVKSLEDRSSSPLRSMIRNRNRRSSSITETSSVKNTTPAPVTHRPRLTNRQRFLIMLLSTLTPSFIQITPHEDFYDDSQIYYS